jgi:hypothetical protein
MDELANTICPAIKMLINSPLQNFKLIPYLLISIGSKAEFKAEIGLVAFMMYPINWTKQ